MIGIITVTGALVIVGLSVWFLIRGAAIPPNARLLFDLWESLEQSNSDHRQAAGGHTVHAGRKEGKLAI